MTAVKAERAMNMRKLFRVLAATIVMGAVSAEAQSLVVEPPRRILRRGLVVTIRAESLPSPVNTPCELKLVIGRTPERIEANEGIIIAEVAEIGSENFPAPFEYKGVDVVYNGRSYLRAELNCAERERLISEILPVRFARILRGAIPIRRFRSFAREMRRSIDFGV